MGFFDFFKKKTRVEGLADGEFYRPQIQNEFCALALWQIKENNGNPDAARTALENRGLSEVQVRHIMDLVQNLIAKDAVGPATPPPVAAVAHKEAVSATLLAQVEKLYLENNHNYNQVEALLEAEGVAKNQIGLAVRLFKKGLAGKVAAFREAADSGAVEDIRIQPNPAHNKDTATKEQADKYIAYGVYQMDEDRYDHALELFDKALELDAQSAFAYANKGTLYFKKGELQKALQFYNHALQLQPRNLEILECIMDVQYEGMSEQTEGAFIKTVKAILEINPDSPNALVFITQYYLKNGEVADALKSVKLLFANNHLERIATEMLLRVFNQLPKEEALAQFKSFRPALEGTEAKYQLAYCEGVYLKGREMYNEAFECFRALNAEEPFSWNYYQMGIMKALQQKTAEALELLAIAFRLEPQLKEDARQFPELQSLWGNQEFRALVNT